MDTTFLYLTFWAAIFGVVFAILIRKGWILGGVKKKTGARGSLDLNFVSSKWQEIEQLIGQGKPSTYKVAIMEADKLVDYVLKAKVGSDGTMADRMKKAQKFFSSYSDYQNLWSAHKTRNMIAHEATHDLLFPEVKRTMTYFEKSLRDLKAL
ncbi:MAG: hypothetical protein Q7S53_03780 [bacterium]|nr:hypothetical protein [bacterium]